MSDQTLWIRTVVGRRIGIGHLMRCIALAESALAVGIRPFFVLHHPQGLPPVHDRGFEGKLLRTREDRSWLARVRARDAVLFDGYEFSPAEMAQARRYAAVACVEDRVDVMHEVDVIVNPNPVGAVRCGSASTLTLLGPRYAMVRSEIRGITGGQDGGHLLVTFGGSDAAGAAPAALDVLATERPFPKVVLVRGPLAPRLNYQAPWLDIVTNPPTMAFLYANAAAAVSAAGSTTWELLHAGVPTALIEVADNQRVVRLGMVTAAAALDLGTVDRLAERLPPVLQALATPGVRRLLAQRGPQLVDGRGSDRIVNHLLMAVARRAEVGRGNGGRGHQPRCQGSSLPLEPPAGGIG